MRAAGFIVGVICIAFLASPAVAGVVSFKLTGKYGGSEADAEKSPTNSEDDLMCWAAAASNVLEWTGWGQVGGMTTTDDMFAYFQDHWTDAGGLMQFGWDWWFDGTNNSQGWSGWSQVDDPGGGFYPAKDFLDFYYRTWQDPLAMAAVDAYLHAGLGTALGIYTDSGGGHAITVWGVKYDLLADGTRDYLGVWVTDSDDNKGSTSPADVTRYFDVDYNSVSDRWHLQDYYGTDNWYIGEVQALARAVPLPAAAWLGLGLLAVLAVARRRRR